MTQDQIDKAVLKAIEARKIIQELRDAGKGCTASVTPPLSSRGVKEMLNCLPYATPAIAFASYSRFLYTSGYLRARSYPY
jgi:phosphoserine aminotransferase